jgi:hypothetical protein
LWSGEKRGIPITQHRAIKRVPDSWWIRWPQPAFPIRSKQWLAPKLEEQANSAYTGERGIFPCDSARSGVYISFNIG